MQDWSWEQWVRVGFIWAGIFALCGGIIAQMTEGMSGRGFVEGMWKGIEWFFIVVGAGLILFLAWLGMMNLASSLNH